MSALSDRRAQLLEALYAEYGVAASWTPAAGGAAVPVVVRETSEDVEAPMGSTFVTISKTLLRVRASDVAAPAKGDVVAVEGQDLQRLISQPRRAKAGGEWICEPGPVR